MSRVTHSHSQCVIDDPNKHQQAAADGVRAAERDITTSLRHATRQSYQTVDVATETTKELQRQDELLCDIDASLDETNYQLKRSERHIRATATWRGVFANWFTKSPVSPGRPAATTAELNERARTEGGTVSLTSAEDTAPSASGEEVARGGSTHPGGQVTGSLRAQRGADAACRVRPRQSEPTRGSVSPQDGDEGWTATDARLLDELHANVVRLRDHAVMQGDLLTRQNEALDHVTAKTTAVQGRLDKSHQNVRKLL